MLKQFQNFVVQNELFQREDKVLLAVSGGVDSVVLCHLFQQSNYQFGIAHVNFRLRGEESDRDETFVQNLAQELEVPFYSISFDTVQIAAQKKASIQVMARDLRYEWLEEIRTENDFAYIATAHHLNDSVETVLYNFTKGTGIRGLHGIPLKADKIIRPMLFARKEEVVRYAKKNNHTFREDASNLEDKYSRNKIRHHVVPVLEKINPSFLNTAARNIRYLQEAEYLFDLAIASLEKELVEQSDDQLRISLKKLKAHQPAAGTILFEILKSYHFHSDQIQQLLQVQEPGALFYTPTHRLLVDREVLLLEPRREGREPEEWEIKKRTNQLSWPGGTLILEYRSGQPSEWPKDSDKAYLDSRKLNFPLKVRYWREGDFFCPLGMNGQHQKLKNFFSNNKLSIFEKEKIPILTTADDLICWIIGHRLDDRFKISEETKEYLSLSFEPVSH